MELVDHADARHHGSAIGDGETFTNVHLQRCQAEFFHHLASIAPLTFVVDLAFTNKAQGDMGQLHQVATGTHAAMHGDERIDFMVDELHKQFHHIGMHARATLQHRSQTGNHGRLHIDVA